MDYIANDVKRGLMNKLKKLKFLLTTTFLCITIQIC